MAKLLPAASAATLAVVLIAAPALAQTVVVPGSDPSRPTIVTPAPAPPAVMQGPAGTYPVDPNTRVEQPYIMQGGQQPWHPPVSAAANGPAPTDPSEYATDSPMTVTGHVDGVVNQGGIVSFRLQTPTEAWTVVVPPGEPLNLHRGSATVVGYPHVEIRNQLLAQSVSN
jgi:hypothetical protein